VGGDIDLIQFVTALLALLNPLGVAPIFAAMTEHRSDRDRSRMALVAAGVVAVVLCLMALLGAAILAFFSITIDDLRVAGGVVVLLVALDMLRARPSEIHSRPELVEGAEKENPAVVPLGIPLLAGPGTIATVIIFADDARGLAGMAVMAAGIGIAAAVVWVVLRLATGGGRLLGATGMNVLTRVMGLLLSVIAINMILTGLRAALPGLAGAPPPG
jgi:multiple antibiotic resistance protein